MLLLLSLFSSDTILAGENFVGKNLSEKDYSDRKFDEPDFTDAKLEYTRFNGAILKNAKFKDANIKGLLEYFMGKNTPARQLHIVNNLRVEKDDESINPLVAEDVESVSLPVAV